MLYCQKRTLLDEPIGFVIPGRKASPESQVAISLIQFEIPACAGMTALTSRQIWNRFLNILLLACLLFPSTASMADTGRMIYFSDGLNAVGVLLNETQMTQHSLGFRAGDRTYYAALQQEEPAGELPGPPTVRVMTSMGHRFSVRNANPIPNTPPVYQPPAQPQFTNACIGQATILDPGEYLLVVRGGRGGDGGGTIAQGAASGFDAMERRFRVTLDEPKVAYIFRGGNGNPGSVGNTAGAGSTAAAGGGASGAPSAIILCPLYEPCNADNSIPFISEGGAGGRGAGARTNQGQFLYGRGAGGGFGPFRDGEAGFVSQAGEFSVGGGGGGAPGGMGGAGFTESAGWFSEAGQNATQYLSGQGGRGYSTRPNGNLQFGEGGPAGGGTVSWTCAGHTLFSYGGGSGGGMATRNQIATGGRGGSGTGTQTTHSIAQIFRLD